MLKHLKQRRQLARLDRYAERQLGKNDCGLSVIKTTLNLCGHDVARHEIRDAIALDEEGSSFDEIKQYLARQKVTCSYKVIELAEINDANLDAALPCIALINKGKYNHYILIYAIEGRAVTLMDPEKGRFEIRDLQYLSDNLQRISTNANAELSYAFMESTIARKCASYGIDDTGPMERSVVVSRYNKIRYMEWLATQVQFAGQREERAFIEDLFACEDDSVIPSRFKTFRLNSEELGVKSPVVLSFKMENNAATAGSELRDPVQRLMMDMFSRAALRANLIRLVLLGVCVSIISFMVVYANQILIDEVIPTRELVTLYAFIGVLFFFRLFELVQNVVKSVIEIRLTQMLDSWLCGTYNEAIIYSSGEALSTYSRGELTQRVNDILRIKAVITTYVNDYIFSLITVAFCLLMTIYISPKIAIVILAVSFAYWVILRKAVGIVKALESRRFTEKGILVNALINLIEGHAVIAKNGSEPFFVEDQQRKLGSFLQVQQKSLLASHLLVYIPRFIAVIGSLSVILITTKLHIVGGEISLGQIFTLMALSEMAFQSLRLVLRTQLNLQEQGVVIDRFYEIRQIEQRATAEVCTQHIARIDLHQLVYTYPGGQFGIAIPSLTLKAGDRILLQGSNGSGKSTLLRVLAGLSRKGMEGNVVFYSDEQTPLERESGFSKVSLIRAEDKIFSDTIQFNVTFNKARGGKNIYKYAKLVGADDFISPITHPLDSLVHDQGANLSTGQKRKLLILRALVSDADVIIFDEIFRGIDAASKATIVRTLNAIAKEKIVIYTTHEDIDALSITRVLDIEHGKISELPVALANREAA